MARSGKHDPENKKTQSRPHWDWVSAILVLLLIWVASVRLVITRWAPNLTFTETLGILGVFLGLALGQSTFGRRAVRWLALSYSLVILPWQLTRGIEAEATALEKLAIVGSRLWFALGEFFTRKPVDDSLLFVAFVSLGFWIFGTTAGYATARHNNTLGAVIPAGAAMIMVQVYDGFIGVRIWSLAVYAFLALSLQGRSYFRKSREDWQARRVFVTGEASEEFLNTILAIAAVSVLLAWTLPGSIESLRSAADAWEDVSRPVRERLTNAVTSLDSPYGTGGRGDFYAEDLFLGRTAAIGDATVFTVRVNSTSARPPLRYYWRGRVYDTYDDGQWVNSSHSSRAFAPETDEISLPLIGSDQVEARLTFTLLLSRQRLLYTPPGTRWVNRPARVYSTVIPGRREDINAWMADPSLSGGDRYQVRARFTNPTAEELRNAGTDYPDWVNERYLSVPESLLPELRPLAEQITEGQATPFDRAQAITAWLREEVEYSTSLEAPPRGVDPLLWVLTEYKKGFCMYYASAEVLMLRSIGIPARMVVGFAQGLRDDETGVFTVRRLDSHAWPEVYFPGSGWVEFEPTSNQAPLIRPAIPEAIPTPPGGLGGLDPLTPRGRDETDRLADVQEIELVTTPFLQTPLGRGLLSALWLAAAGILLVLARRFNLFDRLPVALASAYTRSGFQPPRWVRRWEGWTHIGSIERSFQAINFSLQTLGKPQRMHITPAERAVVLQEMLPSESELIQGLLEEHQSVLYTTRPGNASRARRLAWRLVMQTLLARIREEWERFNRRFGNFG